MAPILAAGTDQGVLKRWLDIAHQADRRCITMPPSALHRRPLPVADVCLFDLGPRSDVAPQILLDALKVYPDIRFVAMSARPQAQEGLLLLRAGARGYGNRMASAPVLTALLSAVEGGEIWAGKQVTDYLLVAALAAAPASTGRATLLGKLTAREVEIAEQVSAGLSNKVIAAEAGISERTVKAHLNSIFRKSGIRNRVQLALVVSQTEEDYPRLSSG